MRPSNVGTHGLAREDMIQDSDHVLKTSLDEFLRFNCNPATAPTEGQIVVNLFFVLLFLFPFSSFLLFYFF